MDILSGLLDHAVLQRNSEERSDTPFTGSCANSGPVTACITSERGIVTGFDGVVTGHASDGRLEGRLIGLPTGGPYEIEIRVGDECLLVSDVLVGDVWLLAGQSNMQGVGLLAEAEAAEPLVHNWFMDDRWGPTEEHVHNMAYAVDPVHADICGGILGPPMPFRGVCPAIPFANMMRRRTGVPQGTIACAHGGTTMAQWDPGRRDEGGKSLYGAMLRRFHKTGARVAGLLWYQGESDANAECVARYTDRMIELIAAVRRDCDDATLPVAIVQISRVVGWPLDGAVHWNSIQDQQRRLVEHAERVAVIPAIDLEIDDAIHISARGQIRLGRRLAQAMEVLRGNAQAGKPPIALGGIALNTVADNDTGTVTVEFDNVQGGLRSGCRPWGFALGQNPDDNTIIDVRLDGNKAVINVNAPAHLMEDWSLWYGVGLNPYCNITDADDRSLPVFGPVPLGPPKARTPFVRRWLVSEILPGAGDLSGTVRTAAPTQAALTPRVFAQNIADRHLEWAGDNSDALVWYACRFTCAEAMQLRGLLGYDGPVKAWLDDAEVVADPAGTNPAVPDQGAFELAAKAGEHEFVVALGNNSGRAWGIFFRLARVDLSPAQMAAGDDTYAMPVFEA